MVTYMIHACPKRLWYVTEYLIPSMLDQGISKDQISVFNDTTHMGNLAACMASFESLANKDGGTWHLQDDVIISRRFKELSEKYDCDIVYGFSGYYDHPKNNPTKFYPPGKVLPEQMWSSFQCVRIPNDIAVAWAKWMRTDIIGNPVYRDYWEPNIMDDWWFKQYIKQTYDYSIVLNLAPNIVDHVDYLIGGSIINKKRLKPIYRARYWEDEDLVDELTLKLARRAHAF